MTTEVEARETTAFESYVGRRLPAQLQEGAGIPAGWSGGADEWAVLAAAAREEHRRRALYDFAFAIAAQGWSVVELASGELAHGSEIKLATGEVRRPAPSKISAELELSARRARDELKARRLSVDVTLQVAIEAAAAGSYTSEPATLLGAIRAATAACDARDREREVARETKAALTKVTVLAVAGPSRRYSPGVYSLSAEELQELSTWARSIEEGARGRSLGSLGHAIWPAYSVLAD